MAVKISNQSVFINSQQAGFWYGITNVMTKFAMLKVTSFLFFVYVFEIVIVTEKRSDRKFVDRKIKLFLNNVLELSQFQTLEKSYFLLYAHLPHHL